MRLEGKTALITGAGSGIGRGTALLFAKEGASIGVADVNKKGADETVEEIKKAGGNAIALVGDIRETEVCKAWATETAEAFGNKIDILFNNAGVASMGGVVAASESEWDRVLDINLRSYYIMTKYVVKYMKKAGKGKIVSTASVEAIRGSGMLAAYCASKGGVVSLTQAMALELAKLNICVNAVCPGAVVTGMTAMFLGNEKGQERIGKQTPIGRVGWPEDIAKVVLFLSCDDADFVTGQAIVVDGGLTVGITGVV